MSLLSYKKCSQIFKITKIRFIFDQRLAKHLLKDLLTYKLINYTDSNFAKNLKIENQSWATIFFNGAVVSSKAKSSKQFLL